MARRLPDDLTAALTTLHPNDLRRASRDLSSNDRHVAEAHHLALVLDRELAHALSRALVRAGDRDRVLVHALDGDRDRALGLDLGLVLDVDLAFSRALDLDALDFELGLDRILDLDRALVVALVLALDRDRDRVRALGLDRDLDRELDLVYARPRSPLVQSWLEERAAEVDVSPRALWGSLLIQRWWQVLVVVWAISVAESEIRNTAFNQDEADRARGQLEGVDRSWQNIELDPQVELDPGDEAFIKAQLTTIRAQLILDGIPEIIDRALAALHERFADRADHEAIIRSALADRKPPWSEDEIDWLLGAYQRANDLVAKVSTDDEEAAGAAHTEIKETLGASIPPPAPNDRRADGPLVSRDGASTSQESSSSKKVGDAVLTGAGRQVGRETVARVVDLVADNSDSPWFRALWETVKALGKSWPFSM